MTSFDDTLKQRDADLADARVKADAPRKAAEAALKRAATNVVQAFNECLKSVPHIISHHAECGKAAVGDSPSRVCIDITATAQTRHLFMSMSTKVHWNISTGTEPSNGIADVIQGVVTVTEQPSRRAGFMIQYVQGPLTESTIFSINPSTFEQVVTAAIKTIS